MTSGYSGVDNLEVMAAAKNYNAFLVKLVTQTIPPAGTVLDFGAGIGTFDDELREQGYALECLEIDPALVRQLQSRGYTTWNDPATIPAGRFEGVFSLNVFEHIADDQTAVQAVFRTVAPGGVVLIYVPAFQLLFSSMDRKVGHVRRYRQGRLEQFLRQAGFQIVRSSYVDTVGFAAALAFKLIGNTNGAIHPAALRTFDRWLFPFNRLLDPLLGRWLGKNLVIVAKKPLA